MQLTSHHILGRIIKNAFDKAADAFSRLTNNRISVATSHVGVAQNDKDHYDIARKDGELVVLVTEMIGDLSGRSYLIMDERDKKAIFDTVSGIARSDVRIQEAMLLELDNIVSASVIAHIANELEIEVYGDVPGMIYARGKAIGSILANPIPQQNSAGFISCSATFKFDNLAAVSPLFVWKLSPRIYELIERQPTNH